MSKTISGGFTSHLALETTTITTCIYMRRTDGTEFRFTEFDKDITVPGPELDARGRDVAGLYLSAASETPSSISSSNTLNVDDLEILTILDNAGITEVDMISGKWDYADYDIFQVVHTDLSLGVMWLMSGKTGEVSIERGTEQGIVELRSKSVLLRETIGSLVSHECNTDLGRPNCQVNGPVAVRLNSTAYALGDRVRASVVENMHYVCTTAGTTAASEPVWSSIIDTTTTDGSAVWTAYTPLKATEWVASKVHALNDIVTPTTFDGRQYRCTTAGTAGGSEPTWNTTIDGTTADNTVVWTAELALAWEATVTTATSNIIFADSALTDAALVDDWFKFGLLTWLTGNNAGLSSEVKTYTVATGTVALWALMPFTVQVGDTFSVSAGCDKAFDTCQTKFNNAVNFQGFPWVPGRDAAIQTPGSKS